MFPGSQVVVWDGSSGVAISNLAGDLDLESGTCVVAGGVVGGGLSVAAGYLLEVAGNSTGCTGDLDLGEGGLAG